MSRTEFEALQIGDSFHLGVDPYVHIIAETETYNGKNHSITTTKGNRMKVDDALVAFMRQTKGE